MIILVIRFTPSLMSGYTGRLVDYFRYRILPGHLRQALQLFDQFENFIIGLIFQNRYGLLCDLGIRTLTKSPLTVHLAKPDIFGDVRLKGIVKLFGFRSVAQHRLSTDTGFVAVLESQPKTFQTFLQVRSTLVPMSQHGIIQCSDGEAEGHRVPERCELVTDGFDTFSVGLADKHDPVPGIKDVVEMATVGWQISR